MNTSVEVVNRSTRYRIHVWHPDPVRALFEGGPTFLMLETGWEGGCGEWIRLNEDSIHWSYLAEKVPALADREGDKEGWVKAFAKAGIEVFG